jgi:hypothetical protein
MPRFAEAKDNPDYTRDWKVGDILRRLSKITPHFLPIPIRSVVVVAEGSGISMRARRSSTLERFIEIYERAGEHLHVPNPFADATMERHQHLLSTSREQLCDDVK